MPTDLKPWKCRHATVIVCKDEKLRAYTDTGVCLGVVVNEEDDTDTAIDEDPIGFFHGLLFAMAASGVVVVTVWLIFELGAWFHRSNP